jgi:hypothetical protein
MDIIPGFYQDRVVYRDSYNLWCRPPPGRRVWPVNFAGGFILPEFVKMRYITERGETHEVTLTGAQISTHVGEFNSGDFPVPDNGPLGASYSYGVDVPITIVVKTDPIPDCRYVIIYRDTPRDNPIVNYKFDGNRLFKTDWEDATRQVLHALAESIDAVNMVNPAYMCDC